MSRAILVCALALAGGSAWADDARVRTTTTVEVLDDKAQIDDVISRLRAVPLTPDTTKSATKAAPVATLKQERPPAPTTAAESRRATGPDAKTQPAGTRRSSRERNGNPDHTERPRPKS
ncbi:MAG TPA: hypothetical protein VHB97_18880 [Polyangia bacterium]|nr:hypothetical protein [Polyangia bacterium]